MKSAMIITAVAVLTYALTAEAQTNCYPQVVATPSGLVTVIVCN